MHATRDAFEKWTTALHSTLFRQQSLYRWVRVGQEASTGSEAWRCRKEFIAERTQILEAAEQAWRWEVE